MKRITKAALGGLAGCALVLGGTQFASGDTLLQQVFPGWLTDLDPDGPVPPNVTTGAFDSAKAKLKVTETSDGNTTFSLEVRDIKPGFTDRTFGSHLHTGSCEAYGLTGPHYQHRLGDLTSEVWFSLKPNDEGDAVSTTVVGFVPKDPTPDDGVMSIVIHAGPTLADGTAGPKEVCLPLDVTTTWASPVIGTP